MPGNMVLVVITQMNNMTNLLCEDRMIERKSIGIKYFTVLTGLLRDRQTFLEEIRQGVRLPSKIISLLVCSSLFIAIYGGIIGALP